MTPPDAQRMKMRAALVDEHIRCENGHDLDAIMGTFGAEARYDDEPWDDHRASRDGVRSYYVELLHAVPDLSIAIEREHIAAGAIVVEVAVRGTHLGAWRGLPATGRPLGFRLCGIYTFGSDDKLAGERIYYDRAAVLEQLGLFHDPARLSGRVATALSHPLTMMRALLRGRNAR
jgi:steroid delta-isomerase-like uncharacterized protein